MYKLIIIYEIAFILFWNILYQSNSGVENWFEEKILTAIFTIFSTMFLGFSIFYIIYITLKITGISEKLKKIKDPRKT
tara:strand:- start:1517 stop:1750 length:234 start_codon:yes stop_codon:yes gene_type:complete